MSYFDYLPKDVIISILVKVNYIDLRPYDLNITEFPEKDIFQNTLDSPYFWYLKLYRDYPEFDINKVIMSPQEEENIIMMGDPSDLKNIPETLYNTQYSELAPQGFKLIYYIYDKYKMALRCSHCGIYRGYSVYQKQARRSDEGATLINRCLSCSRMVIY